MPGIFQEFFINVRPKMREFGHFFLSGHTAREDKRKQTRNRQNVKDTFPIFVFLDWYSWRYV